MGMEPEVSDWPTVFGMEHASVKNMMSLHSRPGVNYKSSITITASNTRTFLQLKLHSGQLQR